jgi:hypothetical protein
MQTNSTDARMLPTVVGAGVRFHFTACTSRD